MTYDIPPLLPLEDNPPIRNQEDLCQFWRALMGPLGFRLRRIWIVTLDRDGYVQYGVIQIDECPAMPDRLMLGNLMETLLEVFADDPARHSTAFLWSRPGSAVTSAADVAWAQALRAAADDAMLPTWPVHLANDHDLRVVAPDDLAA